jgi:hypothetical protein
LQYLWDSSGLQRGQILLVQQTAFWGAGILL